MRGKIKKPIAKKMIKLLLKEEQIYLSERR